MADDLSIKVNDREWQRKHARPLDQSQLDG
jgi:hypothetical protein